MTQTKVGNSGREILMSNKLNKSGSKTQSKLFRGHKRCQSYSQAVHQSGHRARQNISECVSKSKILDHKPEVVDPESSQPAYFPMDQFLSELASSCKQVTNEIGVRNSVKSMKPKTASESRRAKPIKGHCKNVSQDITEIPDNDLPYIGEPDSFMSNKISLVPRLSNYNPKHKKLHIKQKPRINAITKKSCTVNQNNKVVLPKLSDDTSQPQLQINDKLCHNDSHTSYGSESEVNDPYNP